MAQETNLLMLALLLLSEWWTDINFTNKGQFTFNESDIVFRWLVIESNLMVALRRKSRFRVPLCFSSISELCRNRNLEFLNVNAQ